ncbi:hypothetical protein IFM89_022790 [Coptis chinensis]|uniref:Protein kinase domain-containing protein n=1 Tax=Coptis chinensis TaxID=261450 RepID=A0A835LWV3_9MAGN|nr:hypothetical protein IFM89_022790 [Coptis chinensis]
MNEGAKPVKQKLRRLRPEWMLKIKEEIAYQAVQRRLPPGFTLSRVTGQHSSGIQETTGQPTLYNHKYEAINKKKKKAISLDELKRLTSNFGTKALVGEGSYGRVFSATLSIGESAAVKKLDPGNTQESDSDFAISGDLSNKMKYV